MGQSRTLIEGWPALMTTAMAASYLSLDEMSFARAAARLDVCSVDLEPGLIRWRKSDLDKLANRLTSTPTASGGETNLRPVQLSDADVARIADAVARRLGAGLPTGQRALLSVKETCVMLGLARTTIYQLISEGKLSTRKIGRRTLIPMNEIQSILDGDPAGN